MSHNKIGDVLVAQGDLPGALKSFRDGLAIADRLAKSDPGNAGWQFDLGISNERVGNVQIAQGDLSAALASYQARHAIISQLAKSDPGNARWQRDLAISNERLGDIYRDQGNQGEARQAFERALAAYGELISRNPGDVQSQVFSVVPRWRLAALDPPRARVRLEAALAILRPLAEANRLDANRLEWIPAIEGELAALKN